MKLRLSRQSRLEKEDKRIAINDHDIHYNKASHDMQHGPKSHTD